MNMLAILLGELSVLVLGITGVAACVLLIIRKTRTAWKTMSFGILFTAVSAAIASLSFLEKGMGYGSDGNEAWIALMALSLLLAGSGQFIAAFQNFQTSAIALGCAVGAVAFLIGSSRAENHMPLAVASLLLAVASLMSAVFQRGSR
jgi:hypothetical protein